MGFVSRETRKVGIFASSNVLKQTNSLTNSGHCVDSFCLNDSDSHLFAILYVFDVVVQRLVGV